MVHVTMLTTNQPSYFETRATFFGQLSFTYITEGWLEIDKHYSLELFFY